MFITVVRLIGAVIGVLMLMVGLGLAFLPPELFASLTERFVPEFFLFRLIGGAILAGSTVNALFLLKDRGVVKRFLWAACVALAIGGFITAVEPFWLVDVGWDIFRYIYTVALLLSAPGVLVFATAERADPRTSS